MGNSEAVISWRKRTKQRMIVAMGGKCVCCGYNKCEDALHFHHLDPSIKDFGFGAVRASPKSWSLIAAELRKCVMVCAICHAELHANLRSLPDNPTRFDELYFDYRNKESVPLTDICPVCGKSKMIKNKTCSLSCAGKKRERVNWDSIDLISEIKTQSISEIARMLHISDVAVHKRLRKLRLR